MRKIEKPTCLTSATATYDGYGNEGTDIIRLLVQLT